MDGVWIKTRDGSSTLWHNGLGESYRSIKGAFTESHAAFIAPALQRKTELSLSNTNISENNTSEITVGEFGLGVGTNWMLWNFFATRLGLAVDYFAIERDPKAFCEGQKKWIEEAESVANFLSQHDFDLGAGEVRAAIKEFAIPRIYSDFDQAISAGEKAQIWFHDPFGAAVNPDGYTPETLQICSTLWDTKMAGFSYACNRPFQRALQELPKVSVAVQATNATFLKRERLEFYKNENC